MRGGSMKHGEGERWVDDGNIVVCAANYRIVDGAPGVELGDEIILRGAI
jgi:hypothetical protein